jgi:hypothetical protein
MPTSYRRALLSPLLHAIVYIFTQLPNVLVQIANKLRLQTIKIRFQTPKWCYTHYNFMHVKIPKTGSFSAQMQFSVPLHDLHHRNYGLNTIKVAHCGSKNLWMLRMSNHHEKQRYSL